MTPIDPPSDLTTASTPDPDPKRDGPPAERLEPQEADVAQKTCNLRPGRKDKPAPQTPTDEPPAERSELQEGDPPEATCNLRPGRRKEQPTPLTTPTDDRAPKGYVVEEELGRGGMGVVYLARDERLGRRCALKMILSGAHAGQNEIQRFLAEARAIARLQHPGIVQVFEIGEHQGKPFMALEFCGGGSLAGLLGKTPLSPEGAARMVQQLAVAMQAAHEANVIHRDLKPANILLTETREPKITDFGLAKRLDEVGQTQAGSIMGTPSYMPPEQASGKSTGPTADVYSLGAILYECLCFRPPFAAATVMATLSQVNSQDPIPVRQLNPAAPRDLETIALKCLRKSPEQRYVSARDLAADLDRFLTGKPILARPVGPVERGVKWVRRNKVVSALLATIFLVLTIGIVVSTRYAIEAENKADLATKAEDKATKLAVAEGQAKLVAQQETARAEEHLQRSRRLVYASKIALARSLAREGRGSLAVKQLQECQWDLRGWEHRQLWTRFQPRQTLVGHAGLLTSIAWSPDGKRLLTADEGTAKVWDAEAGREVLSISLDGSGGINAVAWSPDGKQILLAGNELSAIVDAEKGVRQRTLKGHVGAVGSVAWIGPAPGVRRIVTGGADGTARIWDSETGREQLILRGHVGVVHSVAWSPDGKFVLTGGEDKTARVWDTETGVEVLSLGDHPSPVSCVAWNPGSDFGSLLFTGGAAGKVWAFDARLRTARELRTFESSQGISRATWSPDGQTLVTVGADQTITLRDAATGRETLVIHGWSDFTIETVFGLLGSRPYAAAAMSPDGARLAVVTPSYSATIWDARLGQEPATLGGHIGPLTKVAWSPDSRRIVTAGFDQPPRIWDAETQRELLTLEGAPRNMHSVAWAPRAAGTRIVGVGEDPVARIWDGETGRTLSTLKGHTGPIPAAAWSFGGESIATTGLDKTVRLWDARTGRLSRTLDGFDPPSTSVAWYGDDRLLTASEGAVKIWTVADGRERIGMAHSTWVKEAAWNPDGKRLALALHDGRTLTRDAETGRQLLTLGGQSGVVEGVAWSPDGSRIATAGTDRTIRLWDADHGDELARFEGQVGQPCNVAWSPDGKHLLAGGSDGKARIWSAHRRPETYPLRGHLSEVRCVAWGPQTGDGSSIVTAGMDNTARVWDARTGLTTVILKGHAEWIEAVAWSPDGKRIVTASNDKTAKVWDARTGKELLSLTHDKFLTAVAWGSGSDGEPVIVTGGGSGALRVWHAETGEEVRTLKGHAPVGGGSITSLATNPDGKRLLSGGFDKTVRLWDLATGESLRTFEGHTEGVSAIAWSPDGERFVSASLDKTVMVREAGTGRVVATLRSPGGMVHGVAWSPDGNRIATACEDRAVRIWNARTGEQLQAFEGLINPARGVGWSPDGSRLACTVGWQTALVCEATSGHPLRTLEGHSRQVCRVAWSADGKVLHSRDGVGKRIAWSVATGERVEASSQEPEFRGEAALSPDGRLFAKADGCDVKLIDLLRPAPQGDPWPFPEATERKRRHREQADRAAKEKRPFAEVFHLDRLLAEEPGNAEWKTRREEASRRLANPGAK